MYQLYPSIDFTSHGIVCCYTFQKLKEKLQFADMKAGINAELREADEELKVFIPPSNEPSSLEVVKYVLNDNDCPDKHALEAMENNSPNSTNGDAAFSSIKSDEYVNNSHAETCNNNE